VQGSSLSRSIPKRLADVMLRDRRTLLEVKDDACDAPHESWRLLRPNNDRAARRSLRVVASNGNSACAQISSWGRSDCVVLDPQHVFRPDAIDIERLLRRRAGEYGDIVQNNLDGWRATAPRRGPP